MGGLNEQLREFLMQKGAKLVGFGDLRDIPEAKYPVGISVGVNIRPEIVEEIHDGPTSGYFDEYNDLNDRLDKIVTAGAEFLQSRGYHAFAQTLDVLSRTEDQRTQLPHKTVATRAGLGWIGRCCLLVTREFGSALRISSLVTDAPLETANPIDRSHCGACRSCVEHCPGGAVQGGKWSPDTDRDQLYNYKKCLETIKNLGLYREDYPALICGKCFEVCPHTHAYLTKMRASVS